MLLETKFRPGSNASLGYCLPGQSSKGAPTPGAKTGFKRKKGCSDLRIVHFTSALANANVAPELRMKLTGPCSEAVHRSYTRREPEVLRSTVKKLMSLNESKPSETK